MHGALSAMGLHLGHAAMRQPRNTRKYTPYRSWPLSARSRSKAHEKSSCCSRRCTSMVVDRGCRRVAWCPERNGLAFGSYGDATTAQYTQIHAVQGMATGSSLEVPGPSKSSCCSRGGTSMVVDRGCRRVAWCPERNGLAFGTYGDATIAQYTQVHAVEVMATVSSLEGQAHQKSACCSRGASVVVDRGDMSTGFMVP